MLNTKLLEKNKFIKKKIDAIKEVKSNEESTPQAPRIPTFQQPSRILSH